MNKPKRQTADDDLYFTVSVRVTPRVMGALEELRDTGFFGNGQDVESVAEELLRAAVRQAIEI